MRAPTTDRLRTATVLGHDVRVSVRPGTDGGPPLLLCNGIGASLEVLQPFVDALDPRIEVIRFDVPGVGGSGAARTPYSFAMLAFFVARMMAGLGHERFDVLGISWGGGLAQQVAFQHPRRCRRVVLAATGTGSLMVPARWSVLSKMLTPRRYRDPAYARQVAGELYGGRLRADPALAARLLHEDTRAGSGRGYRLQLLAGAGWSSLPALPFVRQPVLVLAGTDDPIVPRLNGCILARLLPHAVLHEYDDGHLGLVTAAAELAPVVTEFVRPAWDIGTGRVQP